MTSDFSSGSVSFSFASFVSCSYLDRSLSLVEAEEAVRRLPTNGLLSGSCHVTNCRQLEGSASRHVTSFGQLQREDPVT
jgi:hypothetical protein